jgi:regulator of protease activity HflC (stomatin/prohibitin superfamily)
MVSRDTQIRWQWILVIPVVIVVVGLLFSSFVVVPAGVKGVLLTWGAVTGESLEPGMHIITPLMNGIVNMDIQTQKYQADADSASKDLQSVTTTIALNYHIEASKAGYIYQNLGLGFQDRIIAPAIEESVKASTARFTAEELITKREDLKDMIKDEISGRLERYNIITETVNVVNFAFSDQFNKAIESKVTAEQESLTAQRLLEKVKFEAQQKVETATGDAKAIEIINEQLKKSPQYIQYLATQKWDGKMPLATGGALPFIEIATGSSAP